VLVTVRRAYYHKYEGGTYSIRHALSQCASQGSLTKSLIKRLFGGFGCLQPSGKVRDPVHDPSTEYGELQTPAEDAHLCSLSVHLGLAWEPGYLYLYGVLQYDPDNYLRYSV
jgi:hypothetical protein